MKKMTADDIRGTIQNIYLDMRRGVIYEDKACKDVYILNSILRAMELALVLEKAEQDAANNDNTKNKCI